MTQQGMFSCGGLWHSELDLDLPFDPKPSIVSVQFFVPGLLDFLVQIVLAVLPLDPRTSFPDTAKKWKCDGVRWHAMRSFGA